MNRNAAKEIIENHKASFESLGQILESASDSDAPCKLNRSLTKAMAREILKDAIKGREGNIIPFRYDAYKNREVPSHDYLIAMNILREFG